MEKISTRDYNLDLIKFFAIIATISIHVLAPGANYEVGSSSSKFFILVGSFFRFCVPVFSMASGYLLYTRDDINTKKILRDIFKFLFFFMLAEIFYRFLSCLYIKYYYHSQIDFIAMKNDLMEGNTKTHLYYIFIIILIYIFAPVGNFLVRRENGELKYLLKAWIFLALSLVFLVNLFDLKGLKIIKSYELSGHYNYVFYALLGAYFKKYKREIIKKNIIFYFAAFLLSYILLVLTIFMTSHEEINLFTWHSNNILIFGLAFGIFGTGMKINLKNEKFKAFLKLVSQNIFVIYIIHVAFLDFLSIHKLTYINFQGPEKVFIALGEIILIFIISLVTSISLRFINNKIFAK